MEKDTIAPIFKIVLIGGSAGSLQVLMEVLPQLKPIVTYALIIVLHRKNSDDMTLENLIALKSFINLKEVEDKVALIPGNIYVAPSDYHLLFEKNNSISLDFSEKINYSRPSIDVSFESAADAFDSDVLAILLSGANTDGTNGLIAIKKAGGTTIIQEPASAEMPFMPQNALKHAVPDHVFTIPEIVDYLINING